MLPIIRSVSITAGPSYHARSIPCRVFSRATTFHVHSLAYDRDYYQGRLGRHLIGMTWGREARTWTFDRLQRHPVVNDHYAGRSIVVLFDPETISARIFNRQLGERELTFRWIGDKILDDQTGSEWDCLRGKAIAGPLQGQTLTAEVGIFSFVKPWREFHPTSEFWKGDGGE